MPGNGNLTALPAEGVLPFPGLAAEGEHGHPAVSAAERLPVHDRIFDDDSIPALLYSPIDFRILKANAGACGLYGYGDEEIRAKSLLDLFTPAANPGIQKLSEELRRPVNSIARMNQQGANGQELVVNIVSFALPSREADARVALIENETERHHTEEALRAGEERLRELFENANDFIFLHDLKGIVLEINRAGELLTGYSRTEILGRSLDEIIAPEARCMVMDMVRAHLGGSAPQHYELPVISKTGLLRYLEVSTRITYRRGHPVAIQGIGRDVTERKQAQQRLLESARELQLKNEELSTALELARQATRLKEQFLANTSHELRTPMNGIMGMINLLKTTELTEDQRDYADAVSQCANDLLAIINDLLDLSQIEARRMPLTEEAFEIYESLKSVVKLLSVRAAAKELAVNCELDACLPRFIYGDSLRFRQILTNLIANAVKFTPSGSVTIRMRPECRDTVLRCEVIDSGIGVDEAVRERIFEAFFQADGTTRRRFGGSGLGLAICKQLVEIMGGGIGMHNNRPGPGATFWFELPLRPADAGAIELAADNAWPEPAAI